MSKEQAIAKFLNNPAKSTQKQSTIMEALQYSYTIAEPGSDLKNIYSSPSISIQPSDKQPQDHLVGYVTEHIDKLTVNILKYK